MFSQARSLIELGVDLDVLYIPGYSRRSEYIRAIGRLHRLLARQRFDVIHAHYGHAAVVARTQWFAPLVISYCGSDLLGRPSNDAAATASRSSVALAYLFAQLARAAAATITKSAAMAERLPRTVRRRNHVIPNGVDLQRFVPGDRHAARAQVGWDNGELHALFIGHPDNPAKNFPLAQAVVDEIRRRGHRVALHAAVGVRPDLVPTLMNAADVLLFTSLSEGSPNVIKEAMATELPIVSVPVGDVPDRLRGVDGAFVVGSEPSAMADAFLRAAAIGRAPQARTAVQALSLERVARRVLSVYETVVSSPAPAGRKPTDALVSSSRRHM
ncbi:MAG TPA: glycosyltransferase family 4 protein [Solirubrobacteraceae bacterium]|nr:glycosyltransferase family 4 protein [Solirubrobacteraceae bacterium]